MRGMLPIIPGARRGFFGLRREKWCAVVKIRCLSRKSTYQREVLQMARVIIEDMKAENFFVEVKKRTGLSYGKLAERCGVHRRSFSDWGKGKALIPDHVFYRLSDLSGIQTAFKILPEYGHVVRAGRMGGLKRNKLHGNPGTAEGRRLGGRNSYKKFLADPAMAEEVGFVLRKNINQPDFSVQLAEMIGIILGDGGISRYQITVTLNRFDDLEYSGYVKELMKSIFHVEPSVYERNSTVQITVSRVELVEFMMKLRFPIGGKVRQQTGVPDWIEKSLEFTKSCMKGLFDTDGCFYVDCHRINGKLYLNPALNFTNRSTPLLDFFKRGLEIFGFHPTQGTKYSIFLRKESEVARYFEEIGSSNPKHVIKFQRYMKNKYGEVPKRS